MSLTLRDLVLSASNPRFGEASSFDGERRRFPQFLVPLLIGAVTVAATILQWHAVATAERTKIEVRFSGEVQLVKLAIERRMATYEQVLRGGVGIFNASDTVDRNRWRTYFTGLKIDEKFPGIQGIGYAERVLPAKRTAHIRRIRSEGFPDYTIRPAGGRDVYTAIIYLEPFDRRNRQAFGYDMMSEAVRREAMTRARDTGEAAMSGRVTLVQEIDQDVQAGFLTYLPVYRKGAATATVDDRKKALIGYVYSPFRMNNLMNGILGRNESEIALTIYDGTSLSDQAIMYRTVQHAHQPMLTQSLPILINGRSWTLNVTSLPHFEAELDVVKPRVVLIVGITIAFLLIITVWLIQNTRAKALQLATDMTSALRESEEWFRSAMEYSAIGMALVAPDGRWLKVNRAFTGILGYTEAELLAMNVQSISHPDDREADLDYVHKMLDRKNASYQVEKRYRHKDGHFVWALLSVSLVWTADEEPRHFVSQIQDITDRKEQEQEIRSLNADLEQRVALRTAELRHANSELESFAYTVSHDLRAPLRSISGFTQALVEDYDDSLDEQGRDYVRRVCAACVRMGTLIDELLNLSRVFRAKMERGPVDVSDVACKVVDELREGAPDRAVKTNISDNITADGDEALLRAVLQNLIGNAWKFTAGKPQAQIEFGTEEQDGATVYFVRDNGAGFDMRYADKLFEPFQRLHSADEFEGTGIGLATVARIIRKHGGRIWPQSEPGVGTTMFFTLS